MLYDQYCRYIAGIYLLESFRPVVLKVCSPGQQRQIHLGTSQKCKFSGDLKASPRLEPLL